MTISRRNFIVTASAAGAGLAFWSSTRRQPKQAVLKC
nr:twin-arginine translocation signal domain-containing protein [Brucella anthropi]